MNELRVTGYFSMSYVAKPMANSQLTPAQKAILIAKWATRMTKRHIGFVSNGKRFGSQRTMPVRRWQLVGFPGPAGQEAAGIVDLLAIRKNHKKVSAPLKRGDLFEIIVIQIKGTSGKRLNKPTKEENRRLKAVAKYYNARSVVLAEWMKGRPCRFYWLIRPYANRERAWGSVDPGVAFR
jgi:hypothetical protein